MSFFGFEELKKVCRRSRFAQRASRARVDSAHALQSTSYAALLAEFERNGIGCSHTDRMLHLASALSSFAENPKDNEAARVWLTTFCGPRGLSLPCSYHPALQSSEVDWDQVVTFENQFPEDIEVKMTNEEGTVVKTRTISAFFHLRLELNKVIHKEFPVLELDGARFEGLSTKELQFFDELLAALEDDHQACISMKENRIDWIDSLYDLHRYD